MVAISPRPQSHNTDTFLYSKRFWCKLYFLNTLKELTDFDVKVIFWFTRQEVTQWVYISLSTSWVLKRFVYFRKYYPTMTIMCCHIQFEHLHSTSFQYVDKDVKLNIFKGTCHTHYR